MNAKYYPIIKLARQAAVMKRRFTQPVKLLTSGFLNSESYYPELPRKSRFRMAMDQLGHIWKYGNIERYYFSYGLDIKGFRDKNDYLDDNWFLWKCAMLNTVLVDHDYTCILRDKELFATMLTEWGFKTPRTVACVRTPEEAMRVTEMLFNRGGAYFCKPLDGQCGGGVFRLDTTSETDPVSVSQKLSQSTYLVQTCVVQHPEVAKIYDKSINTLRLVTVYNKRRDTVEPLSAVLRIGAKGNVVDNWAKGGLAAGVDIGNGTLKEFAFYKQGNGTKTRIHPDSGFTFKAFPLPFFKEAVREATELHRKLRDICVIGWDIAFTPFGPVFIEGNDNMEISLNQEANGGLRRVFESIL